MATSIKRKFLDIFRDPKGRIVIWQSPNLLLLVWIACKVLVFAINNNDLDAGFSHLGSASLFAWAYLEVSSGVNTFRKILGLIVACATLWNFFM